VSGVEAQTSTVFAYSWVVWLLFFLNTNRPAGPMTDMAERLYT